MSFKRTNKKLLIRIGVLGVVLIAIFFLLTGCVRGMSPIGWSGVAVSDGTIYTGSKEGRLVSVNLNENNARKWSDPLKVASTGGAGCASSGGGCGGPPPIVAIYGTPVTSGNLVYIAGYNGKINAYSADALQLQWQYPVDTNLAPIISSITISGDKLFFGDSDGKVYALSTTSPNKLWDFATGAEIWSTPTVDNNLLFVGSFDKKIYALDVNTGAKKWEFSTTANNVAPPLVLNGVVYVGSLDRTLYALNETDGSLKWKFTAGNWFWAKPVALNDVIFAPSLDNKVYGLDAKTGQNVVTYDVGGQVASWPIVINNQVIVATEDGKIWALDTNPNNYNKSDNKKIIATLPAGVEVTSPLTAKNDTIYINGSDNSIYLINVTNGTISSPISLKSS